MSGGHWDYCGFQIEDSLRRISRDPAVRDRWPRTARILNNLAGYLGNLEHEMDYVLSGDSCIDNDQQFDERTGDELAEILVRGEGGEKHHETRP